MFRVTLAKIHIESMDTRKKVIFGLDPLMTVKDTAIFVEYKKFVSCDYSIQTRPPSSENITPEHDIYLITNTTLEHIPKNGIRLEYERTLSSYRLKPQVCYFLILRLYNSDIF